jgi:hypothetical protein
VRIGAYRCDAKVDEMNIGKEFVSIIPTTTKKKKCNPKKDQNVAG